MAMPQRDDTIEAIKRRAVEKKAAVSVNSALLEFYWNLGKDISEKSQHRQRTIAPQKERSE